MSRHFPPARILPAVVSAAIVLAACGGSTPPSVSVLPSAADASVTFTFASQTPAVSRETAGQPDAYFVNPGAVIEHEGQLHMFANVFSTWPGHVDVPHLTSSDGASWQLAASKPVLTNEDVPQADPGADVSTGFVDASGQFVLIFSTVNFGEPWLLGRASAPSPDGPWTVDPEPILKPGAAGSIDAGGLSWPSVVKTDAGYALYYTARSTQRGSGSIGMATSTDGVTWTKRAMPVVEADQKWELGSLDRPRVAVTPRGLVMLYASGNDLTRHGVAWSQDGVTWRKSADGPALTAADYPVDGRSWDGALLYRNGTLNFWLEIGSGSGPDGTNVYLATAPLR